MDVARETITSVPACLCRPGIASVDHASEFGGEMIPILVDSKVVPATDRRDGGAFFGRVRIDDGPLVES